MKNSACVGCVHLLKFHLEAPFSRYISFLNICSKIATVNCFEVAISNGLCFNVLDSTLFNQISFGNSDRAAYSDLNPDDGGQSLYPMSTVFAFEMELLTALGKLGNLTWAAWERCSARPP